MTLASPWVLEARPRAEPEGPALEYVMLPTMEFTTWLTARVLRGCFDGVENTSPELFTPGNITYHRVRDVGGIYCRIRSNKPRSKKHGATSLIHLITLISHLSSQINTAENRIICR